MQMKWLVHLTLFYLFWVEMECSRSLHNEKQLICLSNTENIICDDFYYHMRPSRNLIEAKRKFGGVERFTNRGKNKILEDFNYSRNRMAKGQHKSRHRTDNNRYYPKASRMYELVSIKIIRRIFFKSERFHQDAIFLRILVVNFEIVEKFSCSPDPKKPRF